MRRAALAALSLVLAAPALADHAGDECLKIEDAVARLDCYDSAHTHAVTEPATGGIGPWTVTTEPARAEGQVNVMVSVPSSTGFQCRDEGEPEFPRLYIRCMEGRTALMLVTQGCDFSPEAEGASGLIQYRVDSLPPKSKFFTESTSGHALGLWRGGTSEALIRQLFGHRDLVMQATPAGGMTQVARFKVAGIEEAIVPVREACGW